RRRPPAAQVTVLGELEHSGELTDVGGGPFLHTLVQAVPTVANAGRYAQLVAETARRRVIDLGIRLANSGARPAAGERTPVPGGPPPPPPPPSGRGSPPLWPPPPPPPTVGRARSRPCH